MAEVTPVKGCEEPGQRFSHILAAIDGSECSAHALKTAVQMAKANGAALTVLHVMVLSLALYSGDVSQPMRKVEEREKSEGERLVAEASAEARKEGVEPRVAIVAATDSAVKGITDYAARNGIDLIVVGTRGLSGFRRLLVGSVAAGVVHCAPCTVMVVR